MSDRKPYKSDLSDERWALIEPVISPWKADHPSPTGHQGRYEMREMTLVLWQRDRALHHNISAYDAQYVALAETLGVPLITSDARIQRSGAAKCAIEVFA